MTGKKSLSEISMVFIFTAGRSGSTLVRSILDAHHEIAAPIESKFVLHLYTRYKNVTDWNEKTISEFINDLYTNRKIKLFWQLDKNKLRKLFDRYQINSFQDACMVVYMAHESMFEKGEIRVIVDKNPTYSMFVVKLLQLFPKAKCVHLVRDPRAVVYSNVRYLDVKNIAVLSFHWQNTNAYLEKSLRAHPSGFLVVRYEELIKKPVQSFTEIFDFIGVPFQKELLNAHKEIQKKIDANVYLSMPQHRNIANPISSSQKDLWKSKLRTNDIQLIEFVCFDQMVKYDYEPLTPRLIAPNFKLRIRLILGKIRYGVGAFIIPTIFQLPFPIRATVFKIISILFDHKFKD